MAIVTMDDDNNNFFLTSSSVDIMPVKMRVY